MASYGETTPMKDPKGYLTPEEIERIISVCESPRDRILILLLSRTGRRISEVVGRDGITPSDLIDDQQIIFTILKKKTKVREPITVDLETYVKLKEFVDNFGIKPDEKIFPISRQRVFQIIRNVGRKAGIEYIGSKRLHPHHLRHSFAVHASKNIKTVDGLKQLQDLMKHSNINTTAYYLKFNPTSQRELLERMWRK